MESPAPSPTRQRRRWRWLRRIRSGLLVLLALAGGGLWLTYRSLCQSADERFAEVAAEADVLDPGWRWEDLEAAREVIPPEPYRRRRLVCSS